MLADARRSPEPWNDFLDDEEVIARVKAKSPRQQSAVTERCFSLSRSPSDPERRGWQEPRALECLRPTVERERWGGRSHSTASSCQNGCVGTITRESVHGKG
ncbi:hypothetical protein GOD53_32150 [Sinorhizobium medicae]|nr:hypothetical protein [Sinorhizobium medicae]MDX0748247.1 hypothetical protein [Sinorhizobium medicae]